MQFELFKNQKGLSLVELLAALSLFAVVIALSSTVIVQLISIEGKTSGDTELKQYSNVAISELRNQYYNDEDNLCINDDEFNYTFSVYGNISVDGNCIEINDLKETIYFTLTVTNNSKQSFSVQTSLENKSSEPIVIYKNDEGDIDDNEFIPGDTTINCEFDGNTSFNQTSIATNNTKCQPDHKLTVINGSGWFTNDVSIRNVHFKIDNNLISDKSFTLDSGNTDFTVGGNAIFKNSLTIVNAVLVIGDGAAFNGKVNLEKNNSKIHVTNDVIFNNDINFNHNGAEIVVDGNVTCSEDITITGGGRITATGTNTCMN